MMWAVAAHAKGIRLRRTNGRGGDYIYIYIYTHTQICQCIATRKNIKMAIESDDIM